MVRRPGRLFLLLLAVGITVALEQRPPWTMAAEAGAWASPPARRVEPGPAGLDRHRRGHACRLRQARRTCGCCLCSAREFSSRFVPVSNSAAVRAASAVVFIITAALWLRPTIDLLHFIVAIFGRLPIVTPVFVYAAVMAAAGLMLVPPLVATITKVRPFVRPSLETALCLFAVAGTAGFAYVAPGYTHEEPLRRVARARAGRRRPGDLGRGIHRTGDRSG